MSTAVKNKITELEAQKTKLEHDIKRLKNQVDMSMLPEAVLRSSLEKILSTDNTDTEAILSIIQRVEIGPEEIILWTILCSTAPNDTQSTIRSGVQKIVGTPEGTRTPDLLIRSQSLYPTELPAHAHAQVLKYNSTVREKKQVFFSKKSDYFLLPFGSTPALTREAFL